MFSDTSRSFSHDGKAAQSLPSRDQNPRTIRVMLPWRQTYIRPLRAVADLPFIEDTWNPDSVHS